MTDSSAFDMFGDLPTGTVVLEASAGTGKTWAITGLATRYIAERGLPIRNLLMVTFGTAATDELRSRVFARLEATAADLRGAIGGVTPEDALSRHLARHDIVRRLERVEGALGEFDQATIATTHTFCSSMLRTLGIIADWDGAERFVKDLMDLTDQVCDDLFTRLYLTDAAPPFTLATAHEIARAAIDSPVPIHESNHPDRVGFAREVRAEVHRRKSAQRLYTYDDLIGKMSDTLRDPVTSGPARQRLREAFPVVLADEFQDTDPDQWGIVDLAFRGASTLVLVGDPKQSIYAFRGADINAYLAAADTADSLVSLPVNYRSDPGVTAAVTGLFRGVDLGSPKVRVREVSSAHDHERLLVDGRPLPPITVRQVWDDKDLSRSAADALVDADVVDRVRHLLARGTLEASGGTRPVLPGDIAILTRQRQRAEDLRAALSSAGIQAVYPGASSIFDTSAASDWALVLENWTNPGAFTARRASVTDIVGKTYADLMADQLGVVGWAAQNLAIAGQVARRDGLAAAWLRLRQLFDVDKRLLGRLDGRPLLTDLGHVAELLSEAASRGRLTLEGLRTWLDDRRVRATDDGTDTIRRLDADEGAVSILTMHGAKGLQFPIVLLPTPTSWLSASDKKPFVFSANGERRLFVGGDSGRSGPREAQQAEAQAEELRLLYVAMTRAECAVIAWWTRMNAVRLSALHRLLARRRDEPLAIRYPIAGIPGDGLAPGTVTIERATSSRAPAAMSASVAPSDRLTARSFTRTIDQTWRRTSYSGLTATAHEFHEGLTDEPEVGDEVGASEASGEALPMGALPGGTSFGSLVHEVLEYLDWTAPDLPGAVRMAVRRALRWLPPTGVDEDALVAGLVATLRTPLGDLTGNRALSELPVDRRLAELDFDLPMGGPAPGTVGDLATRMAAELSPDDPLRDYPARLAGSAAAPEVLNGFLTGSIDAVLSTGSSFLVVDYKTNRLPTRPGENLTAGHYGRSAMAEAMMSSHYPLQALLYSVALHRFLAWRLPGYDPAVHLGGVGYLFVRGMIGPNTPVIGGMPTGVFTWRPTPRLVSEASALLGGTDA